MEFIDFILFVAIGATVGWLAGNVARGRGFGTLGNIIVGIVGAILGGFVFGLAGIIAGSLIGGILMAAIGAVILLYVVNIVKKT